MHANKLYFLLAFCAIFSVLFSACESKTQQNNSDRIELASDNNDAVPHAEPSEIPIADISGNEYVQSFNVGHLAEHGYLRPWAAYENGIWNSIDSATFLELEQWAPFAGISMANMPSDWYGGRKFKNVWYYPTDEGTLRAFNVLNPALVDIVDYYFVVLQTDYMGKQPDKDRVYKVRTKVPKKVGLALDSDKIIVSSALDLTRSDDLDSGKARHVISLAEKEFAVIELETIGKINDGLLLKDFLDEGSISIPIESTNVPFEIRSLARNSIALNGSYFYYYEAQKKYDKNRIVAYFQAWIKSDPEETLTTLDKQVNMLSFSDDYRQGFSPVIPNGFAIVNGTINIFVEEIGYDHSNVSATIFQEKATDSGIMLVDVLKK